MQPGDLIADKYRLEHVVGRGGMGIVYAATHLQLAQQVAIKFVHTDATADPTAVASLLKEARTIARLKSEHVARILDAGALTPRDPYIVLELLSGSRLDEYVTTSGPRDVGEAAELVIQACHGLADAHSNGVVHRDIKPSNLFLTRDASGHGCVKIIDFGISKAHGRGEEPTHSAIAAASLLGSPMYMSPEQLNTPEDIDSRTDVWSLGIVLHYLVTGRHPFEADNLAGLMHSVSRDPPAPLVGVPAAYAAVVHRCLQKDRDARYPTVHGVAADLLALAPARARWTFERMSTSATVEAQLAAGTGPGQRLVDPEAPTIALAPPAAAAAAAGRPPPFEQTASFDGVAKAERDEPHVPLRPLLAVGALIFVGLVVATVALLRPGRPAAAGHGEAASGASSAAMRPVEPQPQPQIAPSATPTTSPAPGTATAAAVVDTAAPKPSARPTPQGTTRPPPKPPRGGGKGPELPATPD